LTLAPAGATIDAMKGKRVAVAAGLASMLLSGCGSTALREDFNGVDWATKYRLSRGEADFAAYYGNGTFWIMKPKVRDGRDFYDLNESAFAAEVDRITKPDWTRTPSAVVIYTPGMTGCKDGFPSDLWGRVKAMLQRQGFQPVLLVPFGDSFGPEFWP